MWSDGFSLSLIPAQWHFDTINSEAEDANKYKIFGLSCNNLFWKEYY